MLRGVKVMLDEDLAQLYGVETKRLNEAVKRNANRFPEDFMFTLCKEETETLRSEFVLRNRPVRGGRRTAPQAFTDLGVAMLSSVLNSEQAIQANIQIMRAFVRLRELLTAQENLALRVDSLERNQETHAESIRQLYDVLNDFAKPLETPRARIGFNAATEAAAPDRAGRSRAKRRERRVPPGSGDPVVA